MTTQFHAVDYFETAKHIVREHARKVLVMKPRRPAYDFVSVVYVVDQDGQDWEIEVGIAYDCTYDPGVYSGPWENSYPASGDMYLTDVTSINDLPHGITDAMVTAAAEDANDRLTEEAWEDYHSKRYGCAE